MDSFIIIELEDAVTGTSAQVVFGMLLFAMAKILHVKKLQLPLVIV